MPGFTDSVSRKNFKSESVLRATELGVILSRSSSASDIAAASATVTGVDNVSHNEPHHEYSAFPQRVVDSDLPALHSAVDGIPLSDLPLHHVHMHLEHDLNSTSHSALVHAAVGRCNNSQGGDNVSPSNTPVASTGPGMRTSETSRHAFVTSPSNISVPNSVSSPSNVDDSHMSREERIRQRRMLRNRESAARSRDKRKFRNAELEASIKNLAGKAEKYRLLQSELSDLLEEMAQAKKPSL